MDHGFERVGFRLPDRMGGGWSVPYHHISHASWQLRSDPLELIWLL